VGSGGAAPEAGTERVVVEAPGLEGVPAAASPPVQARRDGAEELGGDRDDQQADDSEDGG
jgi:hypothetical protein